MTGDTWSIGQLARLTGLSVRTIRYYSDSGILPETTRSAGGHRRYGREALDHLLLVKRLRALGLPLPAIRQVLTGERPLGDVIAAELDRVASQLASLRWRQASLQALDGCTAEERVARLDLLARVPTPHVSDDLVRFWRRVLPVTLPARLVEAITAAAVPSPPREPTPRQVLAYAELHALVTDPSLAANIRRRERENADGTVDVTVLFDGLGEACSLAASAIAAGRPPQPGDALDCFVQAHARARRERDTPVFRARLYNSITCATDPWITRYWDLVGTVTGDRATLGASHGWLTAALRGQREMAAH